MNARHFRSLSATVLVPVAASLIAMTAGMIPQRAAAQVNYAHFPTPSTTDGRFLSVTGTGINTLAQPLSVKLASPAAAASIEIGFFDGETGGNWDQGTTSLNYTLYADSAGDGTGTFQIATWAGSSMTNNAWYNVTVSNHAAAQSATGDHFYVLRVTSSNPAASYWSNFKIRTDGTIAVPRNNPFAYTAAINSFSDAQIIYPSFPALSPTTYDGTWDFYFFVPNPVPFLEIADGDFDYGKYDCTDNDSDDPSTPNVGIPTWAVGTAAVPEGVAGNGAGCTDAGGAPIGGFTTSNPPDDSRQPTLAREPNAQYELITPGGTHYANTNPSGNLEWELFRIDTAAFDSAVMDYHANTIGGGIYHVHIIGVDMSNLNAWRFPFDATGVDMDGLAVPPLLPSFVDGSVQGTIFYDANSNGTKDAGEPGVPSVALSMTADFNNDGVTDQTLVDTTDDDGEYGFSGLRGGSYHLTVDMSTLTDDVVPTGDLDGLGTPNTATFSLTEGAKTRTAPFGYRRTSPAGTRTRGYWVNHPENWPVESLTLGATTYSKAQAIGILQRPTKGDKTYSLAAQLIATKLNLSAGSNGSCIVATVADADEWIIDYPIGSKVKNNAPGDAIQNTLDSYNNGNMCAGHMN
jgi:SdrD B-like domain